MRRSHVVAVVLVVALALGWTTSLPAQVGSATAQLSGTVRDESGGAVASASVSLREVETNRTYSATANDKGFYAFVNLPPGRYELKASFKGFAHFTQTGIVLTVAQSATNDVTLKVAAKGEQVVVTTEAPAIEPTKTEISQVIETRQIDNLPISTRLFTDFALLTPSVATSRTSLGTTFTDYETTQISFGGQRSFNNQVTVDGADFVNMLTGVQRATPPQPSVQEFRVVNNSFGAEYGRALGGIVNIVTKSGTNDLHGSVYEYFQNNALDARSLLQPAATATEPAAPDIVRSNQYGATIGGPIQKNKLFYFINYDGKRQTNSPVYAPSLFDNITELDGAKGYLGLSPEGCYKPLAQCTGTPYGYLNSVLKTNDNDYGFARVDYQINPTNQFSVRYNVEDARDLGELIGQTEDGGGVGTPSGGRNLFTRDQSLVGSLTTELKPNLINNLLVQYARRHYNFPGATGEPDLSVVNDLEFGHNFGTFDQTYESRAEFADSISWVKGKHIAKFGFDGNYIWDHNNYPGFEPVRVLLTDLNCLVTFANFVNDFTSFPAAGTPLAPLGNGQPPCPLAPQADGVAFIYWGVTLPRTGFVNGYTPPPATGGGFGSGWPNAFPTNLFSNFDFNLNHGYWGFYGQDQWRVTPKFTLNYGLRWDFESGLSNFSNSDYTAFAPRLGFAYSPNGKTVIRAGFGMFFDRNNMTFYFVTGNQKVIPGYLCVPASADANCAANGFTNGVVAPQVQKGSASGGWQLNALPGYPGTPALPCPPLPAPFCNNAQGTANLAAVTALGILADLPYDPVTLTGPCIGAPVTGALSGACGVGAGGIQRDGRLPYAEQASLEVSQQFGKGFTLNVGYLFVGAHKLVRGNNINIPCPQGTDKPGNPAYAQGILNPNGTLSQCQGSPSLGPFGLGPFFATLANPSGLELGVPGPGAASLSAGLLDYNNNVVNANYHGLNVTALERLGHYFNLTANYTWSHSIDNGNFTTFINLPVNQFDYNAERANSNQDVRHRFVANFTAEAPEHSFARQFSFSSIITLQSGRPFTLFAGENVFGDVAGLSTDRVGGAPVVGQCTSTADCNTVIGRNTYVGDPLYSWDLHLSRYFKLTEKVKLDLAIDAFNFLNRPNVDEV
ncbi:MAG TPA: carboxypeptidase regulatory-like domain-containing protein, partial [Candidatus Acidoferrales bacterium]|nr:carboxypeptidase regulatory-like domain-containing protein [Candidatus Acidoferrales bacterium]